MMRTPALAIAMAFFAGILCGQQGQSFDVASIKPLKIPDGPVHFNVLPERLDVKNMNLRFLIEEAYDLPDFQVSGLPVSLNSHHFDIAATTVAPVSNAEMRIMLRNLLIERFHLATHWDSRVEAIYRLEVLPKGPAMKESPDGYPMANSPMLDGGAIHFTGPMSMRQLAQSLTRYAGTPVLDATNLEGYFKIALTFAREDLDAPVGLQPGLYGAPLWKEVMIASYVSAPSS